MFLVTCCLEVMSSEDTLLRVSVGVADDLVTTPSEVQVQVLVDAKLEYDGTVSDTIIHSSDTELDRTVSEERDVLVSPSNQVSNEITGIVLSQDTMACGISGSCPSDKEESNLCIVQVANSTTEKVFSRGTLLTPKESWRTRIATTRLKDTKNYISYHNITYTVSRGWFFQDKPPKVILNNVRLVTDYTCIRFISILIIM